MAKPAILSLYLLMLGVARAASEIAKTEDRTLKGGGGPYLARAGGKAGPVGFPGLHMPIWPPEAECVRGHYVERRARRSAPERHAGPCAPPAPLCVSGRCGVSPHEGVGGDSVAAPAQGKAFPFRLGDFVPVMFAFLRHSIMVT